MPFNAAGVYSPTAGATSATPGSVIQSAVWNAAFGDISSALTLLGQQLYGSTPVITTPYVPVAADAFLLMNVAGAAVVNLPSAASRNGYPIAIKDISGAAHTNNITINRNGSDTIDGATSLVINVDYEDYMLFPISGGWAIRT